jgi:radical SAM protein (TIGR01212 family)
MNKKLLNERIYTYSDYLLHKFGRKVFRVGLSTGIICPHRIKNGGCIFCNPDSFTGEYQSSNLDISNQLKIAIPRIKNSCGNVALLAYFQDETSTAGNLDILKSKFKEALEHPEIIGLVISTRPDFINKKIIEMLKSLEVPITIELGMQTIHDESLKFLNRGHSNLQTQSAIDSCSLAGFDVGVHLILGIPGETKDDMLSTIRYISAERKISQVKFHNLVVYKNTALAEIVRAKKMRIFNINEYIEILAEAIALLRNDIIITRLFTSNIRRNHLTIEKYEGNKTKWMNDLRLKLIEKNIFQGSRINEFTD